MREADKTSLIRGGTKSRKKIKAKTKNREITRQVQKGVKETGQTI
jgi:hypothetical protein